MTFGLDEGDDVFSPEMLDLGNTLSFDFIRHDGQAGLVPDVRHPRHVRVLPVRKEIPDLDGEEVEALLRGAEDLSQLGLCDLHVG